MASNAEGAVWKSTPCWYNCGGSCVVKGLVKDGEILRVKTDDTHPDSWDHPQNRACPMGHAVRQRVYGEGRLKYPMKRKNWSAEEPHGELRGIDEWERISWDEAIEIVGSQLEKAKAEHGPESIFYLGFGNIGGYLGQLLGAFGGNTSLVASLSWGTFMFTGPVVGFDHSVGNDRYDLFNSDYIVLYANNAAWCAFNNTAYYLKVARERGVKFVFVGPEYAATAGMVNAEWIPVRPAGDTALLLGVAYEMLANDEDGSVIDWDFLNRCTVGFDADHMPADAREDENFKDYLLGKYDGQPKTPEWASELCGTPVELIKRFAEIMGKQNAVAIHSVGAPARNKGAENFPQMLMTIAAMGGHYGKPGHGCTYDEWYSGFNKRGQSNNGVHIPFGSISALGSETCNPCDRVLSLEMAWDAIVEGEAIDMGSALPGVSGREPHAPEKRPVDIRVIVSDHNNYLATAANVNKGIEAFRKVDFVFSLAFYMKMEAMYADVVLPISTRLERRQSCIMQPYADKEAVFGYDKVIEPLYECKSDREIAELIATRLGIDYSKVNEPSDEQLWFDQFAGSKVTTVSGAEKNVVSITQEDIDRYGVVGEPQDGIVPIEEFIEKGVYRIERSEGDDFYDVAYEAFRNDPEANPLNTSSGKMEIYCQAKSDFYDLIGGFFGGETLPTIVKVSPLPKYLEMPLGYKDSFSDWENKVPGPYPIQVANLHYPRRVHTDFDDLPWLREALTNPVFVNKDDAAARGIKQGDIVRVFNDYGELLRPAAVTRTVMPGVIMLPHGARPRIDRETGIDLAGAENVITASMKMTSYPVQGWNTNLCQYEKYDGPIELEPDCEVAPFVPIAE